MSNNDINLLFKKISILEEINQNEEIIKVYNQILTIDENRDDIYFKKSKLLFNLSRYRNALKSIESAIKINPLNDYIIFKNEIENKFVKQISNQNFSAAFDYFEDCNYLFANEVLSKYDDSKSLELRAICLYRMGRNNEALNVVNQLLKFSNDESYVNLKAKIYLAMGDKFNSIKFFKEAANSNKKYISDLAFAYGRFGDIDSSIRYYSRVNNELSKIWLDYYRGSRDLLISGLQNDFFNYPHLICLKINMYIEKAVSFFNEDDFKNTLKYLKLSEKYLFKLELFIDDYKLNNEFVAFNFSYLGKILEQYQLIDFEKLKFCNNEIFTKFLDISNSILNYFDGGTIHLIKIKAFLSNFYKSLAKLFINNSVETALKYFKNAALCENNDGETWLYIANLSKENQIVFYNKALFCFNKKYEMFNDVNYLKLKAITLFYLNREPEAFDILRNYLPKRFTDEKIIKYIKKSMKNYSG